LKLPEIIDNRHVNVATLSALGTGRLHPQGDNAGTHSVRGLVDTRFILRREGISKWKISKNSTKIEPATFRPVAQCLK